MRRWATLLIPGLAALVLYAPTISNQRTFDDLHQVPKPGRPPAHGLAAVWNRAYWGTAAQGGLYRPVTSTSFWLEGRLNVPLEVRHGANVLLHAAVTVLVVRLALALGLGTGPAGAAGLLFALHPVHVESVAGLVGRGELLAALGILLALGFHDRIAAGRRRGGPVGAWSPLAAGGAWLAAAGIAFVLAGIKESTWALPVLALFYQVARKRPVLPAWPLWGGYVTGIGGHLLLRLVVLGGWLNAPGWRIDPMDNGLVTLSGLPRLLGGVRMLGYNLAHLVFPTTLAPDYSGPQIDPSGGMGDPRLWAGTAFLLASLALPAFWLRSRSPVKRASALAGGWLLVSAVLLMNLVLSIGTIFADRLLYWPSVAWVLLLAAGAAGVGRAVSARPGRKGGAKPVAAVTYGVLAILAVGYAGRALDYLPAWKTELALFGAAVKEAPRSPRAWINYGIALQGAERFDEAITAFGRAEQLWPEYEEAWAQESAVLMQVGRREEAKRSLDRALALAPEDTVALVNQGVWWMEGGEIERAAARFREVLAGDPRNPEALQNLAIAVGKEGDHQEAASLWRRLQALEPDAPVPLNNLAWLLATELGDPQGAVALARQAVALSPGEANYHDTLAEALRRTGDREGAEREAREALRLEPGEKYRLRLEEVLADTLD